VNIPSKECLFFSDTTEILSHTGFVASALTGFVVTFLTAPFNELCWLDFQKAPPCVCLQH